MRVLVSFVMAAAYMSLAATLIAQFTPTSPIFSWQSGVVFGGGATIWLAGYVGLRMRGWQAYD